MEELLQKFGDKNPEAKTVEEGAYDQL